MKPNITYTMLIAVGWFALSPAARAVNPAPDGGYPGGNTAEGDDALFNLTSGVNNAAIGYHALLKNTIGDDNTAIGTFALELNTGGENTATGYSALLANTSGFSN